MDASKKVLLIDDEQVIRTVGRRILELKGYEVELACDGPEAIARFRELAEANPTVILDLTMPTMSGEQTLDGLLSIRPDARVILSSGLSEAEVSARFADRPIRGFVQKPYRASRLIETVDRAARPDEPDAP